MRRRRRVDGRIEAELYGCEESAVRGGGGRNDEPGSLFLRARESLARGAGLSYLKRGLGPRAERDVAFNDLCAAESVPDLGRASLREPTKWRESAAEDALTRPRLSLLPTHGSAFSVADIRRSPEKVLWRLLDAEDNVDVFALCERAVAPFEGRVDAAVNVERLERFGELSCCLEEGAEGLLRRRCWFGSR